MKNEIIEKDGIAKWQTFSTKMRKLTLDILETLSTHQTASQHNIFEPGLCSKVKDQLLYDNNIMVVNQMLILIKSCFQLWDDYSGNRYYPIQTDINITPNDEYQDNTWSKWDNSLYGNKRRELCQFLHTTLSKWNSGTTSIPTPPNTPVVNVILIMNEIVNNIQQFQGNPHNNQHIKDAENAFKNLMAIHLPRYYLLTEDEIDAHIDDGFAEICQGSNIQLHWNDEYYQREDDPEPEVEPEKLINNVPVGYHLIDDDHAEPDSITFALTFKHFNSEAKPEIIHKGKVYERGRHQIMPMDVSLAGNYCSFRNYTLKK